MKRVQIFSKQLNRFFINHRLKKWIKDVFDFNRSITGSGTLKTLKYIKKNINKNFKIKNYKSGTKVYDWKIPKQWEIYKANIYCDNKKICDFDDNNLHIVGYSYPIKKRLNYNQLKKKLNTLKNQPDAIPYVTSYYKKDWGFCMKYADFKKLDKKKKYDVLINSKLFNGKMNFSEMTIKGKTKKTVIIMSYICHPSMANNELSGVSVVAALSKIIKNPYYTYKLLLIPETIGAIAYINKNNYQLKKNLIAGFNLTCCGDKGSLSYISSIYENTYSDLILKRISKTYKNFKIYSFLDRGSNERQFGCQNLKLPFCTIMRSKFGNYRNYHTSKDDLKIVSEKKLRDTLKFIVKVIDEIEKNKIYVKNTTCEPFLTKYNLINTKSFFQNNKNSLTKDILNITAYASENLDTTELSKILKIDKKKLNFYIDFLYQKKILKKF